MKILQVVAAIIVENNRIFAARRASGEWDSFWEFPGGKIQPGETAEKALVREIREELAVEIEIGALYETVEYDYPTFHLSMKCFLCRIEAGNPELKVHSAAKWLSQNEIDRVAWLPANKTLVEKIKNDFPEIVSGMNPA